jgi:hypothetical protein
MVQFRPIKERESHPREKRARKIAAFIPIPLVAAGQHIATEYLPLHSQLSMNRYYTCAVERRWTTAGESPARELGSLHPETIRAAVEETKPSKPLV